MWALIWVMESTAIHLKMLRSSFSAAPYQGEPVMVVSNAGLLNLLGWAAPNLILANGNDLAQDAAIPSTRPARLDLLDVVTGVGTWLEYDADLFVSLVE